MIHLFEKWFSVDLRLAAHPLRCIRFAGSPRAIQYKLTVRKGITMPNIKSAKKRVLVSNTKALQNKMIKSEMKTVIKQYLVAVDSGDVEAATKAYGVAVKTVDQAAAHGIIHKNAADHKKSQFTKKLNALKAAK